MNFLSAKETAKILGIHLSTLANLRMKGEGPPFEKVGWGVLYTIIEVEKYKKEIQNESQRNRKKDSKRSRTTRRCLS